MKYINTKITYLAQGVQW